MNYIFFYGTLMRGFGLRHRLEIDQFIRFIALGTIRGALFDLGSYPAAICAEGRVHGELYVMTNADILLPRVDAVEGFMPQVRWRSRYTRTEAAVQVKNGQPKLAWVYFYTAPLGEAAWIPSGDYRFYLTRRNLECLR